ncbi:MAG TPA: hypothetical protein VGI50_11300, partial [Solirubrobacteraceae bacterium]
MSSEPGELLALRSHDNLAHRDSSGLLEGVYDCPRDVDRRQWLDLVEEVAHLWVIAGQRCVNQARLDERHADSGLEELEAQG